MAHCLHGAAFNQRDDEGPANTEHQLLIEKGISEGLPSSDKAFCATLMACLNTAKWPVGKFTRPHSIRNDEYFTCCGRRFAGDISPIGKARRFYAVNVGAAVDIRTVHLYSLPPSELT